MEIYRGALATGLRRVRYDSLPYRVIELLLDLSTRRERQQIADLEEQVKEKLREMMSGSQPQARLMDAFAWRDELIGEDGNRFSCMIVGRTAVPAAEIQISDLDNPLLRRWHEMRYAMVIDGERRVVDNSPLMHFPYTKMITVGAETKVGSMNLAERIAFLNEVLQAKPKLTEVTSLPSPVW